MKRKVQRQQWLSAHFGDQAIQVTPASADASFRSYYRVITEHGSQVLMDAPPQHEDCHPFLAVRALLSEHQIRVPELFAQDTKQGFLLLGDLGSTLYLDALNPNTAKDLYRSAIDTLVTMQGINGQNQLPPYDADLLQQELQLFMDWFVGQHLGLQLNQSQHQIMQHAFKLLVTNAIEQPQCLVHRDFHSRNLMVVDDLDPPGAPGVIDFQDAVWGPFTYDLVSLLRDCYISWEASFVEQQCHYFLTQIEAQHQRRIPLAQFQRWFDLMGIQRHLKAIGIFCRLNYRDGKPGYLHDIPRTLKYVLTVTADYPELHAFAQLVADLQPKLATQA